MKFDRPSVHGALRRGLALTALLAAAGAAHAVSYFTWEMVELPASSGASCGNGTPYRFFVNRTPLNSKLVVMFEGGGACWEQGSCANAGGEKLAAVNPNGIPADYMQKWEYQAKFGLVTPFTARIDPLQSVQTQSWNIVYAPYCTGDVHTGNKVAIYSDADATKPLTYYHRGATNIKAMTAWLKANLARPSQMLLTGFSAGGVGSTANYPLLRTELNPKKSALLADSGPLYWAPRSSTPEQSPSLPLHNRIRDAWGLDGPQGMVTELIAKYPTAGDANNMGSLSIGLGKIFPQDRIGYAVFQEDTNFSAFSYQKFYPDISGAPTDAERLARINLRWRQDITTWVDKLKGVSNTGWYVPNYREINGSHCLTIVTFGATGIDELKIKGVGSFLDNLLDGTGTPMRALEADRRTKPMSISDLIAEIIGSLNVI
ncbi:MAG: hypothetical protein EPO01_06515 [Aquabacterium sp.]|nr:MAG: hypothetical protein EPO01_06515 [Aquabacterium sp.]